MQDFLSAYFVVCVGFVVHAKRTCTDEFIYFQKKRSCIEVGIKHGIAK